MKKTLQKLAACCCLCIGAVPALAADGAAGGTGSLSLWPILSTLAYSAIGMVVLLVAFKLFDLVTPYKLHKELAEDQNTAVGVMLAGLFIALSIIIAAAII